MSCMRVSSDINSFSEKNKITQMNTINNHSVRKKISKASFGVAPTEDVIKSALAQSFSKISGSKNKLSLLKYELNSGKIFDGNGPINLFRKISNIFGLDIVDAFGNASEKIIQKIEVNNKITEQEILDAVNGSILSIAPGDITESKFREIYNKLSPSSAEDDGSFKESFQKWISSQHTVMDIASKVIYWIISYLAQAAEVKVDVEKSNITSNYINDSVPTDYSAIASLPTSRQKFLIENKNYDTSIPGNFYGGHVHFYFGNSSLDEIIKDWANSIYPGTIGYDNLIKSSSEFAKTIRFLNGFVNKYKNDEILLPQSVSQKQIVDSFIDEISDAIREDRKNNKKIKAEINMNLQVKSILKMAEDFFLKCARLPNLHPNYKQRFNKKFNKKTPQKNRSAGKDRTQLTNRNNSGNRIDQPTAPNNGIVKVNPSIEPTILDGHLEEGPGSSKKNIKRPTILDAEWEYVDKPGYASRIRSYISNSFKNNGLRNVSYILSLITGIHAIISVFTGKSGENVSNAMIGDAGNDEKSRAAIASITQKSSEIKTSSCQAVGRELLLPIAEAIAHLRVIGSDKELPSGQKIEVTTNLLVETLKQIGSFTKKYSKIENIPNNTDSLLSDYDRLSNFIAGSITKLNIIKKNKNDISKFIDDKKIENAISSLSQINNLISACKNLI